jgi:CheY-like chemotaxis protein
MPGWPCPPSQGGYVKHCRRQCRAPLARRWTLRPAHVVAVQRDVLAQTGDAGTVRRGTNGPYRDTAPAGDDAAARRSAARLTQPSGVTDPCRPSDHRRHRDDAAACPAGAGGRGRHRAVEEAVDGASGVAAAIRLQPELILLDQQMPAMTGLQALPALRAACPAARIVMWSSAPVSARGLWRPVRMSSSTRACRSRRCAPPSASELGNAGGSATSRHSGAYIAMYARCARGNGCAASG